MRITSGKARGISLKSPKGDATRPATDAARQAVFSSIADFVADARVFDFFAGTGAYGLEALSRGVKSVVFFENGRHALPCLYANIESVKKSLGGGDAQTVSRDVFSSNIFDANNAPDIIFADPPYEFFTTKCEELFALLKRAANTDTLIVLEAPADFEYVGNDFEVIKRLGKTSRGKPSQLIMRLNNSNL